MGSNGVSYPVGFGNKKLCLITNQNVISKEELKYDETFESAYKNYAVGFAYTFLYAYCNDGEDEFSPTVKELYYEMISDFYVNQLHILILLSYLFLAAKSRKF